MPDSSALMVNRINVAKVCPWRVPPPQEGREPKQEREGHMTDASRLRICL